MAKYKYLFITHELSPFLELTNIAKETSLMTKLMQDNHCEVRVLMPRFGVVNERRHRLHEVIRLSGSTINVDGSEHLMIIKVASLPAIKMQVYFIDNEDYFHRKQVFRDGKKKFFTDNDERLIFFCKGAIDMIKQVGWIPDVIHCHGWFSSLIPAYINHLRNKVDSPFVKSKLVYSAYPGEFAETLGNNFIDKIAIDGIDKNDLKEYKDADSDALQIGAAINSDGIIIAGDISDKVEKSIDPNKPAIKYNTINNDPNDLLVFYQNFLDKKLLKAI
ncbi:MAG: glycogen/starch synthase [Solitalea-like symbiont of Acarus siro]